MTNKENKHKKADLKKTLTIGVSLLIGVVLAAVLITELGLISREVMMYVVSVVATLLSIWSAFTCLVRYSRVLRFVSSIICGVGAGLLSLVVFLILTFDLAWV